MDGIHDLGGMHGFGPVRVEPGEPVFHARWEGRVVGLQGVNGGDFVSNLDKFRHAIERLEPVSYLTAGYYGRWLRAIETRLVEAGELEPGAVDRRARKLAQRPSPTGVAATSASPLDEPSSKPSKPRTGDLPKSRYVREVDRAPRYRVGDAVRARTFHPAGHTRLPRYARGKRGRIESIYAAYIFPDTNAHDLGESPEYVYCVAFRGDELWGPDAEPGTLVHLDCFEPYLDFDEGP